MELANILGVFISALSFLHINAVIAADEKRPFTVKESFNRTQLHVPSMVAHSNTVPFLLSEDHDKLIYLTSTGDYDKKTYYFRLHLYDTREILNFLHGVRNTPPHGRIVTTVSYDQHEPGQSALYASGIQRVQFTEGDSALVYLGADLNGKYQLFKANLDDGTITQLTRQKNGVTDYFYNHKTGDILFTEPVFVPQQDPCSDVSFLADELYSSFQCIGEGVSLANYELSLAPSRWLHQNLFKLMLDKGAEPSMIAAKILLAGSLSDASLSNDGKSALLRLKLWDVPEDLARAIEKSGLSEHIFREPAGRYIPEVMIPQSKYQYYGIVRFDDETMQQFVELPITTDVDSDMPLWLSDDLVYLAGAEYASGVNLFTRSLRTFTNNILPLHSQNKDKRRFVYLFDLKQGKLISESAATISKLTSGIKIALKSKSERQKGVKSRCENPQTGEELPRDGAPACYIESLHLNLRISTEESFDQPPNIYAIDTKTRKKKLILELNPQFKGFSLGKVKLLKWSDQFGRDYTGAIVFPPDYRSNRRYPLVVQANGFSRYTYSVDGSTHLTTPFAAQALANRGIVVLQVPHILPMVRDGELQHSFNARAIDSAIDYLASKDVVDTERIGISGYSGTGQIVMKMVTFSKYVPQAVIIIDAVSPSPAGYNALYRYYAPGMLTQEHGTCGGQPWGSKQADWISRNPYYHLDKVRTAILIEQYSTSNKGWWDIFVGLKRLNKPVEYRFSHIHQQHPVQRADAVIDGQERAVEWYDYWLNGSVATDSAKRTQYERWHKLRTLKSFAAAHAISGVPLSKMDCPSMVKYRSPDRSLHASGQEAN